MLKYTNNWGGLNKADDEFFTEMHDNYVPLSGKADTLGGEIIRAISRIVYKFYNDGDTTTHYYSCIYNDSYGAEKFLLKNVPKYELTRGITDDEEYEMKIAKNLKSVVDYLRNTPELFEIKNVINYQDLSPREDNDIFDDEYVDDDYEED